MKTFHFVMQAKGGVGKSFLVYLYALGLEQEPGALFLDVDNSTKTSDRQLAFLRTQPGNRLAKLSLVNERAKQDRQLLIRSVLELGRLDYTQYFLDFGAPESEQFPALLEQDMPAELLRRVETQTASRFVFYVVIGGNTAFKPCMEYLATLVSRLEGAFTLIAHPNQYSFVGPARHEQLAMLTEFCAQNRLGLVPFGAIDMESEVGRQIVHYAQLGKGLSEYDFLERLLVEKQIEGLQVEKTHN